jgi:CTP-dependent riboflavin kinase
MRIEDKMSLSEIQAVLLVIDTIAMLTTRVTTGNQIAKNLKNRWSRATTYRKLKKMERMGLVTHIETLSGHEWLITDKGVKVLERFNELPF